MQFPRININGTNGETLRCEYYNAYRAVTAAIVALEKVTVHGRDYQTIANSNAASDAYREHRERLSKLRGIEGELRAITQEITEQTRERAR